MKATKGFMQMLLVGAFAFLTISLSSCSKQEFDGAIAKSNENTQQQVLRRVQNLKYSFRSPNGKTTITSNGSGSVTFSKSDQGGANFAADPGSSNFAEGQSSTTFNSGAGTTNSYEMRGTLSAGGGNMTIDGKSINVDYIFCADGTEIFGNITGFDSEDFNLVIGISGDFTDPENAKLNYLVFMVTVGDGSSGTYKLDLDLLSNENPTGKFGIIQALDFSKLKQDGSFENIEDAKLYVSTKGNLNASSGSFSFSSIDMAELTFDQSEEMMLGKKVKADGNLQCQ